MTSSSAQCRLMNKKFSREPTRLIASLAVIAAFLLLLALGGYVWNFRDLPISKNPKDWADFGAYFGGALAAPLSFLALIALLWTIRLQLVALKHARDESQRQDEYLSRKEKKEEWLSVIRDLEAYIRWYLAIKITKNGLPLCNFEALIVTAATQVRKEKKDQSRECANKVLKNCTDNVDTTNLDGLASCLGDLANYLRRYRQYLAEKDDQDLIGHYTSMYIRLVADLTTLGVMREKDGLEFNALIFNKPLEKSGS